MDHEVNAGDGAEPQPSAPVTDSAAPDAAKVAEDELDAKVKASLGDHYVPLDGAEETQAAEQPEKKQPEEVTEETPEAKPDQGEQPEGEDIETPPIPRPEPQASKLDKRVATLYVQSLILSGEKNVPSVDDVIADLRKYPMAEKVEALHVHRLRVKELKGIRPNGKDELDEEDNEALRDAQREEIRNEIYAEENEKQVKKSFVEFLTAHPELDESSKEYSPTLARAVETLWRRGMPINEAYETVTEQVAAAKEALEKATEKSRQAALSGAVSASTDSRPTGEGPTYAEMALLQESDPTEWERLVRIGYTPKS
jgi:hypothetical protein